MKAKYLILFSVLLSTVSISSCEQTAVDQKQVNITQNLSKETNAFSYNFWKEIEKIESQNNYMVSPLSLHIALGMLLNGADGGTKAQLIKTLGLSGKTDKEINETYRDLIKQLPLADPKVTNTIANAVFQSKDFSVESAFKDNLKEYFSAQIFLEDFNNAGTINKINKWAADNTNQKITKILEQIEPNQILFLLNALYFKGDWKEQFKTANTKKETFTGTKGKQETDMMNATATYGYLNTQGSDVVELPYGNGQYAMYVVLPKKDIQTSLNELATQDWSTLRNQLKSQKVVVALPKFKTTYSKKLNAVLANMGLDLMFSNQADLSKIAAPAGKLKVGFVKQDTYIATDEKGTEAAAVKSIGIETTSIPVYPEVICDKPFLYLIAEKTSNSILFVGKISHF